MMRKLTPKIPRRTVRDLEIFIRVAKGESYTSVSEDPDIGLDFIRVIEICQSVRHMLFLDHVISEEQPPYLTLKQLRSRGKYWANIASVYLKAFKNERAQDANRLKLLYVAWDTINTKDYRGLNVQFTGGMEEINQPNLYLYGADREMGRELVDEILGMYLGSIIKLDKPFNHKKSRFVLKKVTAKNSKERFGYHRGNIPAKEIIQIVWADKMDGKYFFPWTKGFRKEQRKFQPELWK